jgi:oligopeptide transport system permease protein
MMRFIVRRLLVMVPLILTVLTITFFMVNLAPGSPFSQSRALPPEVEARLRARYGFDLPRWQQYLRFMSRTIGFSTDEAGRIYWHPWPDFGESIKYRDRRVNDIIKESLPVSAVLGLTAYLLALIIGTVLGLAAAWRRGSWVDRAAMLTSMIGMALPSFVAGPLLIIAFSLTWHLFPPGGVDWIWEWGYLRIPTPRTLLMPALTLSLLFITYITRLTRDGVVRSLDLDYIRTARAKGLGEFRILLRHALRPSLLPIVSFSGPALAFLITGTVVVESVFSVPGLGRYFIDAANNRDYFLILGITAFAALSLTLANLVVDLVYAFVDPRIRYD